MATNAQPEAKKSPETSAQETFHNSLIHLVISEALSSATRTDVSVKNITTELAQLLKKMDGNEHYYNASEIEQLKQEIAETINLRLQKKINNKITHANSLVDLVVDNLRIKAGQLSEDPVATFKSPVEFIKLTPEQDRKELIDKITTLGLEDYHNLEILPQKYKNIVAKCNQTADETPDEILKKMLLKSAHDFQLLADKLENGESELEEIKPMNDEEGLEEVEVVDDEDELEAIEIIDDEVESAQAKK